MKILYLQQHFALPEEPGFVRPWQFCKRFAMDGWDVTAVRGGDRSASETHDGVRVITVGAKYDNEMAFRRRIIAFLQYMISTIAIVVKSRSDIVYASSGPLTVAVPAVIASFRPGTKMVFEVRDLWPEVPIALGVLRNPLAIAASRALEKFAYKRAKLVVCLSPGMEEGVKAVCPAAKTVVIPNGCDFDLFEAEPQSVDSIRDQLGSDDQTVLVGYAGGFGYMYDLEWPVRLAGAMARSSKIKVRFFFIGEGADSAKLRNLAVELGIEPEALFLGRKPKSEVAGYLNAADVVLSPLRDDQSLEACSLNKVFDAMAARKPVLFNHGGWLADEVTSGDAGWRLSREMSEAVATVEDVCRSREELKAAGDRNRVIGEEKFGRDQQFETLYLSISGLKD